MRPKTPAPEQASLERTFSEYRSLMLRLAYGILHDAALAEDAVSDAMVKVLEHADCLDAPVSPRTKRFVSVLTEHAALDLLRKRQRETLFAPEELPGPIKRTDPDLRLALLEALDALPGDQRTAVLLSLTCGLTAKQVGRTLGCTTAKAEKLISRGKQRLRTLLQEVD